MAKFDLGAAWDDSVTLLKSHTALTGAIAAVFLFLPTLAVSWFGPTPVQPAAGASLDQVIATFRDSAQQAIPYQLLISLIATIGGVGVMRLWLARTGTSVGDALVFAFKMALTVIAVQVFMGFAIALAGILLVTPGFLVGGGAGALLAVLGVLVFLAALAYFWSRASVALPVVADRELYNPVAALRGSWVLTKGNARRIFLFFFLVFVVILIASALLGGVAYAIFGSSEGVGRILSGLVEASVAAAGGLVSLAITTATYRQLATRGNEDIFS
jgi:hypothetical protein